MSKNKLRQYPGAIKGRARLFPYAMPQISPRRDIPPGGSFFIVGNCFGRNLEKALARAGRTFLSSPDQPGLPGSATEQFQRFNAFNLDVSSNEIAWAIDPEAPSADNALIRVGQEWVDMQIHWSFAHSKARARKYRHIYNQSYARIAEADTVVVSVGGIEQWFDAKTGLYMNGTPTVKMSASSPERYQLHRLDLDACVKSLRRFCDLVINHCPKKPLILVAVSPVSQPGVHSETDALIDQYLAKSIQRTAVEIICTQYENVEYLPALEMAMLSDFKIGYRAASPNHSNQCLADRIVAEILLKYEGESAAQRRIYALGHGEAQSLAGAFEMAVETTRAVIESGDEAGDELDVLFATALSRSGRHAEAIGHFLDRLPEMKAGVKERVFSKLVSLIRSFGSLAQLDRLNRLADDNGFDLQGLGDLRQVLTAAALKNQFGELFRGLKVKYKAGDFLPVIAECKRLLEAQDALPSPGGEQILTLLIQSFSQTGRHPEGVQLLIEYIDERQEPDPQRVKLLLNLARSHADTDTIDRIIRMGKKLGPEADTGALLTRREKLESRKTAAL